jgi:hypothetical protein
MTAHRDDGMGKDIEGIYMANLNNDHPYLTIWGTTYPPSVYIKVGNPKYYNDGLEEMGRLYDGMVSKVEASDHEASFKALMNKIGNNG